MAEFTAARHHLHQHHPHAGDGRGAEGELRAPRCADGPRPGRVHALEPVPQLRPGRPAVAEPRPVRAVQRPRVDAAVLAHPPRRGSRTPTCTHGQGDRPSRSLPMEQLKRFRQLGSKTPGHPENELHRRRRDHDRPARAGHRQRRRHGDRPEVEGRALRPPRVRGAVRPPRLRHLRRRLHDGGRRRAKPRRWPGTSSSTTSRLIYDDNGITIDGHTDLAFSEDVAARFEAYGWNVLHVNDGNDLDGMREGHWRRRRRRPTGRR